LITKVNGVDCQVDSQSEQNNTLKEKINEGSRLTADLSDR